MNKRSVLYLCMLISTAMIACGHRNSVSSNSASEGIHVSGQGSVSAAPDIALAQLGVQTFAPELEAAMTANSRSMNTVIGALKAQGIADDDIQTANFSVNPQYDYEKETREIVGYWVDNRVRVTFRDLSALGNALQSGIDAGANTVYDLRFTIDNRDELLSQARTLAVADARQRAQTLAEAAGVKLGKALNIRESSSTYPVYARGAFDEAVGSAVPIESGEVDLSVYVDVLFDIR